ncbi:MAG: glycosyl transferase, family 28, partial [Rubrobacteraceae bacterium]|nr:glycosyl transferase, family 28 [Rubrobacteraceae bacterium]
HGLRHVALEVDLLERLQSPEGKAAVSGKNLLTTMKKAASMYRRVLDQEWAASQGANALVYHPKALGGYHIAEALDVPGVLAHPLPMFSPTRAFPNPVHQLRGVLTLANCTVPSHDKPLAQGDSEATADLLTGERARRSRPANPKADLLQFPCGTASLRLGRLDFRNGVLVLE